MWRKNALFLGLCLLGAAAIATSLWRRDRVAQPESYWPERFVTPTAASASSTDAQVPVASVDSEQPSANKGPSLLGPPRRPQSDIGQTLAELNREFREHWEKRELQVAPPADHLTIARRMSLALTGTIPSLEEIRALERVSPEHRTEWWTSHLLEDRRFSDYFAERFARAYVGIEQGPFLVYRRRRFVTWLSDKIAENRPYDEIVRKLIAEDGLWTGSPATNFVTATSQQQMNNEPDEIRLAARVARAFLGMRIDCLQCHDDKLGNIILGDADNPRTGAQADFHHLAAFFSGAKVGLVGVYDDDTPYQFKFLNAENEVVVPPQVPYLESALPKSGNRREQLAAWVTSPENKPFARATVNRVWALMFGRPLVEPIDDIPLMAKYPPGLQLLADDFVAHGYDLQRLIRLIAASDAFQRASQADFEITPQHEEHWAVFPLARLRPEQVAGSLTQAASLTTIDAQAHIVWRLAKAGEIDEFVRRYGDIGEDEFEDRAGTIPQRLLMMNGSLVKVKTRENLVANAATRIARQTASDERAVEAAYLAVLSRRPDEVESRHFANRLAGKQGAERIAAMEDLYWVLINSTEFSWNH